MFRFLNWRNREEPTKNCDQKISSMSDVTINLFQAEKKLQQLGTELDEQIREVGEKSKSVNSLLIKVSKEQEADSRYSDYLLSIAESERYCEVAYQTAKSLSGQARSNSKHEQRLEIYDAIISRYWGSEDPRIHELLSKAMLYRGTILESLDRHEEAVQAYKEVTILFEYSQDFKVLPSVYKAMIKRAALIGSETQLEAIDAYDELIEHFKQVRWRTTGREQLSKNNENPAVPGLVGKAMMVRARLVGNWLGVEQEILAYHSVIKFYLEYPSSELIGVGCIAIYRKLKLSTRNREEFYRQLQILHEEFKRKTPTLAVLTKHILNCLN